MSSRRVGKLISERAARLLPYGFVSLLYGLLSLEIRTRTESADWPFFMRVLTQTLHGDPFTIYANRTFGFHTFAYGPVSLYVMAPSKLLSEALAAPPEISRWLTWLPFYFADILAALLLCRLAAQGAAATRAGTGIFLYTLFLSSWLVIFASPVDSHFESLVLVFLLAGVQLTGRGRYVAGGILCGLALLTKQSALVIIIPHAAIVFRSAGTRAAAKYALSLGATALLVMLPYIVVDPVNVYYMAVTLPGSLPVAFQSVLPIWRAFPGLYTFITQFANAIILALVAVTSLSAVLLGKARQGSTSAYALYAVCALFMLDFEKWGFLHYFLMPFAFLVLWEVRSGNQPGAGLLLAGFGTAMYVLNADVATRLSFSTMIAPLALLLFGLTFYASYGVFRTEQRST